MKTFKQLIEPCLPDGGVPFEKIAKLTGFDNYNIIPRIDNDCIILEAEENSTQEEGSIKTYLIVNNCYDIYWLFRGYKHREIMAVKNQLQIFQKLMEWNFIEMPFNMPCDKQLLEFIEKMELKYGANSNPAGIVKDALEYFIKKENK